jgi:hypothetical protein
LETEHEDVTVPGFVVSSSALAISNPRMVGRWASALVKATAP